jgi:hypoxanthine phosphoribosyltransferase
MKKTHLSDSLIKDYTFSIIRQMHLDDYRPDLVIGLVRGGCVPAIFLSQFYDIPCYMQNKDQEIDYFEKDLRSYFNKEFHKVLVVDEINDSGRTLVDFNNSLFEIQRDDFEVRYAALVSNTASLFTVDYFGLEINKLDDPAWMVFPWEEWWLRSTKCRP